MHLYAYMSRVPSVGGPFVKSTVKLIYVADILCVHYVDNERGQIHVLPRTSEIL
jgi:hypothetical protein